MDWLTASNSFAVAGTHRAGNGPILNRARGLFICSLALPAGRDKGPAAPGILIRPVLVVSSVARYWPLRSLAPDNALMILLNVTHVTKQFGPDPVLDGVTFEVRPGDKIGMVGPNGAGKTTLLGILAGRVSADSGTVELHSSARLDYLEQQPTIVPGRTLWQEAAAALESLSSLARDAEGTGTS